MDVNHIKKSAFSEELTWAIDFYIKYVDKIYKNHEVTFDYESFHGRFHILRCLFLADALIRRYVDLGFKLDAEKTFLAIMFHDACRKDNGIDLWENESNLLCRQTLLEMNKSYEFAFETGKLILKERPFTLEGQILYDVDVLDYYRFFCLPLEDFLFDQTKVIFGTSETNTNYFNLNDKKSIINLASGLVINTQDLSVTISTAELISVLKESYLALKPW